MPYVNVKITAGASREQKSQIVREMTDSLIHVLGKKPEHIHIVLDEVAEENWGFAGMRTDQYRSRPAE